MINILGVKIDNNLNNQALLSVLEKALYTNKPFFIVTPNPEIILKSHKDEEFFYILNQANLSLADGFGLKLGAFLISKKLKRITGADVLPDILSLAEKNNKKVLICNREDGLSSKDDIESVLKSRYPDLRYLVLNMSINASLDEPNKGAKTFLNRILSFLKRSDQDRINEFKADVMISNFGAPYQEKFLFHNMKKIATLKMAIGIGGAFDFLTGKIKRAPYLMRYLGLEWLWRLFKQPSRMFRIYNAVVIFSFKLLYWRFISPFVYRKNVACLVYREASHLSALDRKKMHPLDRFQILLVKRVDEINHWQIPQGGTDGMSLKEAGLKELREELNNDNFVFEDSFPNLHKYKVNLKSKYGFKGQKQGLMIARFTGSDFDIKTNFWDHSDFKWINARDFVENVSPYRREASQIFLDKFLEHIKIKYK